MVLGRARLPEVAEKLTNACTTLEERRFSAAQSPQNQRGLQPPMVAFCVHSEFFPQPLSAVPLTGSPLGLQPLRLRSSPARGFTRLPLVEILVDRQKDRQHGISPLPKIVTVKEILIRAEPVSGFRSILISRLCFRPTRCMRVRIADGFVLWWGKDTRFSSSAKAGGPLKEHECTN